jgi:hypothetical protein
MWNMHLISRVGKTEAGKGSVPASIGFEGGTFRCLDVHGAIIRSKAAATGVESASGASAGSVS